jgi:hypothetical protein
MAYDGRLRGWFCSWRWLACWVVLVVLASACGYPRPADVSLPQVVAGRVHGLWDGADGVTLRLQADGVDTLLTVSANGPFEFAPELAPEASYIVTVVSEPASHRCVVASGGNGTVSETEPSEVSIGCTGPVGTVTLVGTWNWTFDPTEETQSFDGSIAVQDVALMVSGSSVLSARVADRAVEVGALSPRIDLALGATVVPVALTAGGGLSKTYELVFRRGAALLDQVVYGKASNAAAGHEFGVSLAVFENTLVVGAVGEASKATGVNGDQTDRSKVNSGAAYVFVRSGTTWTQQAYLKASNTDGEDGFGLSVALYGDTLAVGATSESSKASGINGNQADNTLASSGAVYVFVRSGTTWTQQAYIKASNPGSPDFFGYRIALHEDTLAVGAYQEASSATGVDPPNGQADNSALGVGAVYVFTRQVTTWTQQAYIKPSNAGGYFGLAVALSRDTLAVGAPNESSAATGINNDQNDRTARAAGAVYVFVRANGMWTQQAYIKASNTQEFDDFGHSVALSGDTLAVGASNEASGAKGVAPPGGQSDNSAAGAGAVYVFTRHTVTWTQEAYIKASNTDVGDAFGWAVALSGDTLVVGAQGESSSATGIGGDQSDNSALVAGALYVFARGATGWTQRAYVKGSNTGSHDQFGAAVAVSHDIIVGGSWLEANPAAGINPDGQSNNSARATGAIYLFR